MPKLARRWLFVPNTQLPRHSPGVFSCEDVNALYEERNARGVRFTGKPTKMGRANFAHFVDPDGNELGLSDAPLSKS